MHERRNYYRTLQVQPDATPSVIRNNYRALLQKEKLHPDLGGSDQQAAALNAAYHVLRDPARRAAYDHELLRRYSINILTQARPNVPGGSDGDASWVPGRNRRNYYRVLQIQKDASPSIVYASYNALMREDGADHALLSEAYQILTDPDLRANYDRFLVDLTHVQATQRLTAQYLAAKGSAGTDSVVAEIHRSQSPVPTPPASVDHGGGSYQPLITRFCAFCKTPHSQMDSSYEVAACAECDSPLYCPVHDMKFSSRRDAMRIPQSAQIKLFTYWPCRPGGAKLLDLSPKGALIASGLELETGLIVKIDGEQFRAVGEVVHSNRTAQAFHAGVSFRAVCFLRAQGNFLSASA